MTRQVGNQAFSQAEQFLKDARLPENVQAIAQQSVAKTHEFYAKSAATAQESAKVLTEVAETSRGYAPVQATQPFRRPPSTSCAL